MGSFIQNNINFNNINADTVYKRSGKYTHMSNANGNKFDTSIIESELTPSFNAIEIDWNGAQLNLPEVFGGTQTISSTGQLLSIIQQLANAINNGSSQQSAISIDTQTTVNGIRHFAVSSSNAGSLNLSTTAGTLNKTAFTMVANTPQSFTLSNIGSAGKTPNITISSGTVSNDSCTIYVTSDIASTLYMGVDSGAFGDMTSYSYQTSFTTQPNQQAALQWVNPSGMSYVNNPRITAWQTSPGTTAQSIDYTITAQQNNDVYSISGTLPGGKGQSITSYAYFDINLNNTPAQTTYYWYAGQTNPSSMTSISPVITSYENGGGWHELGTTLPTSINQLVKGGTAGNIWYVAVPANSHLVPGSSSDPDTSVETGPTKVFNGVTYQIYIYVGVTGTRYSFELNT